MKTTRHFAASALAGLTALACSSLGLAATVSNFVVTPSSPFFGGGPQHVVGIAADSAPGYPFGSFGSDGVGKSDLYFPPEALFGREVLIGEIEGITYWTKKGTTHAASPSDWFLNIYTKRYTGQTGASFYGIRIGTELYFSAGMVDPVNTWNQWTTDGPTNYLRFFESTYGYFGSYSDPHFTAFVAGSSVSGVRGASRPYASQPILAFSPQTASAWAAGFTGKLDGLSIMLTDGSIANINFEAVDRTATNKDMCKNDGWKTAYRADFTAFKNQGDCIQYVNTGK